MPYLEFFGPTVDLLLFSVAFYAAVYAAYAVFLKKRTDLIAKMDIRYSIIGILLIVANYFGSGAAASIFGYEINWLLYYLVVSFVVELVIMMIYKKYMGIEWKDFVG